ncbi:SRPBCC family protein [Streptomyces sp. NPDC001705]
MTRRSTITTVTTATPGQAFDCLSDLRKYGDWLPRSVSYWGTTPTRTSPAGIGNTYVDRTRLGAVRGVVTDTSASRLIAFHQATDDDALAIDIIYRLGTGSRRMHGHAHWPHHHLGTAAPDRAARDRRENRRTMARLKAHLDGLTTGRLPDA